MYVKYLNETDFTDKKAKYITLRAHILHHLEYYGKKIQKDHNLNYVELEFNEAIQTFHIRGEDTYANIDHELTAPPLEPSKYEEEKDNNED